MYASIYKYDQEGVWWTVFTMFVRHKVRDYETWKKAYDAGESLRKEHGITGASIHRDIQDANDITVTQ